MFFFWILLIHKDTRSEETLLFSVESEKGEVLVIPRSFRTIRAADGKPSLTFPLIITTFHNKPPSEMEGSYLVAKSDHFYGRVQMKKFGKVHICSVWWVGFVL